METPHERIDENDQLEEDLQEADDSGYDSAEDAVKQDQEDVTT